MTAPDKIDIRGLENLSFQKLSQENPEAIGDLLLGSDLTLDPEILEPTRALPDGSTERSSFVSEENLLREISQAAGKDHFLDAYEVQGLAQKILPQAAASLPAPALLASFEKLMKDRYRPILANLESRQEERALNSYFRTLNMLETYGEGLLLGEVDLAFGSEGATRADINAMKAHPKFAALRQSIEKLQKVLIEGVRNREDWALAGNLSKAMSLLDESDVDLLEKTLCASRLHDLLNTVDLKERYTKLKAFADGDRAKAGGNGSGMQLGWRQDKFPNLYFAGSLLRFLGAEAETGNSAFDAKLHRTAKSDLGDLLGMGGDRFNYTCVALGFCDPSKFRDWSDSTAVFRVEAQATANIDRGLDFAPLQDI